jgi:hypothetical protein
MKGMDPMDLIAVREEGGTEVRKGDEVISFRGEKAIFVAATRPRGPGHTGKVTVHWKSDPEPYNDLRALEYYDTVFDLEVYEREVWERDQALSAPRPADE